jgi:hypothetical protein
MMPTGFCRIGGTLLGVPVAVGCEQGCECVVRSPLALEAALRLFASLTGLGVSVFLAHPGGVPPSPRHSRLGVQGSLPDSTPAVCSSSPMHTQAQKISGEAMQGAGGGRLFTCLDAATVGLSTSRVSVEAGGWFVGCSVKGSEIAGGAMELRGWRPIFVVGKGDGHG